MLFEATERVAIKCNLERQYEPSCTMHPFARFSKHVNHCVEFGTRDRTFFFGPVVANQERMMVYRLTYTCPELGLRVTKVFPLDQKMECQRFVAELQSKGVEVKLQRASFKPA
jgi:hypothetical protein